MQIKITAPPMITFLRARLYSHYSLPPHIWMMTYFTKNIKCEVTNYCACCKFDFVAQHVKELVRYGTAL
jgi:hypothetical protein